MQRMLSLLLNRRNGPSFNLGGDSGARFIAMLGYSASLRVCLSGLALVKDISVTCFMRGGPLIGEAYYPNYPNYCPTLEGTSG